MGLRAGQVVLCFAVLAGCASPGLYSTARTTPKGAWSGTVAAEVSVLQYRNPNDNRLRSHNAIVPPTLEFRYGVTDDIDVAIRAPHLMTLGGDAKWNFFKSEYVDVAVAGRAIFWYPGMLHAIVPVIFDLNLSESITVVAHGGGGLAIGSTDREIRINQSVLIYAGALADAGLGINIKLTDATALHVEGACLFSVPSDDAKLCAVGVALNYQDVSFDRPGRAPGPPSM
jgi:hypothetical protein